MKLYALLMAISFVGPLLLSFDKKVAYYKIWPGLFVGIFINGILFISWDYWFTLKGIWSFNPNYLLGSSLLNLPLEEWAFFMVVPFASVFIYACIKAYFPKNGFKAFVPYANYFFIAMCSLAIILFYQKTYTRVNCSIALMVLILQQFWIKGKYMGFFWQAYFVHLIPFLLINGVLTGAITPEPIVSYNPEHIIGWRFLTIPLEDSIYALTCLLIPVSVLEYYYRDKVT